MKSLIFHAAVCCLLLAASNGLAQSRIHYYCTPCNNACDTIAFDSPGNCPHCNMELVRQSEEEHKRLTRKRLKIAFYLQDGVEVLDFAGPMEVFNYANFEIFTVSKTKGPITSQGVLKILPDYTLDDAPAADVLAFFGGNAGRAVNDPDVIGWINRQTNVMHYFSVCTGAFILGRAGILNGQTVTTFHESIDNLRQAVPQAKVLSDVRFVDNGKVITTAGISAGIDGALHLVAKLRGEEAARRVAAYMEYDKWVPAAGLVLTK
ncbi:DJ-1/PfpI family protein [uncultured Chitinophaga sp.]|jgi:Transcriptional regulator containing an amidase domain and an AraC-type DNA-binding HTH domain|uniref:DJ-1/PfpI family protein n=1 Tax=uncultured Chitinophaga sp. TaxID=339340 RepID=UPI002607D54F|nr:DJ-1/PfpI family protein [uncultured Chitinophaga sp.]